MALTSCNTKKVKKKKKKKVTFYVPYVSAYVGVKGQTRDRKLTVVNSSEPPAARATADKMAHGSYARDFPPKTPLRTTKVRDLKARLAARQSTFTKTEDPR